MTLDTGEQTEIYEPEFLGDTLLVGQLNSADARSEARAVFLNRIRAIERKATSWTGALAVVAVGLVAMLAYGAFQCSGDSGSIC